MINEHENRLIIHLLKNDSGEFAFDSRGRIDWDYLFQTAETHRIVPLLFKKLSRASKDSIPPEILAVFRLRYARIAAHNFARTAQLLNLVRELEKNNLPVIAYKGAALAELAYKDASLRQFTDIDLLIRKQDFGAVKCSLAKIGGRPAWNLSEAQEKAVLKNYYEYPFFYGEINTLVEIHWEFLESFFAFDLPVGDVWRRTQTITLGGRSINTLSTEDYLLVLAVHGSKHFWKRLGWVCDVAKLIENATVDWNALQKRAAETGVTRMLALALHLAKDFSAAAFPDRIERLIATDKTVLRLGEMFRESLFGSDFDDLPWTRKARIHLQMREKAAGKLKYSYRLLTSKTIDKLFMPMGRPR